MVALNSMAVTLQIILDEKKSSKSLKFNTSVGNPQKWPSSCPPQKWPSGRPSKKNGRTLVHRKKWPSGRPPGGLKFRDFDDFFSSQICRVGKRAPMNSI